MLSSWAFFGCVIIFVRLNIIPYLVCALRSLRIIMSVAKELLFIIWCINKVNFIDTIAFVLFAKASENYAASFKDHNNRKSDQNE